MPVRSTISSLLFLFLAVACLSARAEDGIIAQGTAVVVSADGYLLVNAGVVHEASKIVATIAGNDYPATVVKTDEERKLTLLKVTAAELHALPLSQVNNNGGNIVGYPTEPFLGAQIKMTQTWYSLSAPPGKKPALMLSGRSRGGGDGDFIITQSGELAGMLIKGYWEKNPQPWQNPAMPASEMLPLLTAAGVTLATTTPGTDVNKAKPALALLTIYSADSPRRVNPTDHAVLMRVPAGEFLMGSEHVEPQVQDNPHPVGNFPDEFPQHKVTLDTFWVYKYQVTVGQYRQFCAATHHPMPSLPYWAKETVPIINVTWQDAMDYARWAGAVLPTEAQYEKAARGTDARAYPWGTPTSSYELPGSYYSPGWYRSGGGAQSVGSFPDGVSPYGAQDMAGNVWEWCADWYLADYYQHAPANNPPGPATGHERVIRGGSWFTMENEDFRCAARAHLSPEIHNYFTGFRCVVVNPQ